MMLKKSSKIKDTSSLKPPKVNKSKHFSMSLSTLRSIRQDLALTERTMMNNAPDHRKRGSINHFYRIPLITYSALTIANLKDRFNL